MAGDLELSLQACWLSEGSTWPQEQPCALYPQRVIRAGCGEAGQRWQCAESCGYFLVGDAAEVI